LFLSSEIKFYIISLGCSKNQVDSERINGTLISAGFKPAETSEEADVIIINTCGFINDAKTESIEVIFDSISQVEENDKDKLRIFMGERGPEPLEFKTRVVVTGCLSQRYFNDIKKDIPEIDLLYGIPDEKFITTIAETFNIKIGNYQIERKSILESFPYSYIKISDGCSNNCSYCAIPLIRGQHVAFSPEFIMEEAQRAVDSGAEELIIIAQDIAAYSHSGKKLPDIVNEISQIEGVRWIRLLYCHPDNLTDQIIDLISENPKVVPYLDIPFQHINERILLSMGRKGNFDTYLDLVKKLRSRAEGVVIRSTFMVGYPGESEEEFEELLRFVETARLDKVGCFTYSPEEDTRSFQLEDDVPEEVKTDRYNRLMSIQREISLENLQKMVGEEVEVILEGKVDEETWVGRSIFDAPEVDGVFYLTAPEEPKNIIVRAIITDAVEYDLIGEII